MDNIVGKAELLRRLRRGKAEMDAALGRLTPEQMIAPGMVGEWSVKDVIAHFTAHEQRALGEIRAALRGKPIPPYPNYDLNRAAIEAARWQSLEAVRADWDRSFQEVIMTVELMTDADFDPDGDVVRLLEDTIDGALANNSYQHYAEHISEVLGLST